MVGSALARPAVAQEVWPTLPSTDQCKLQLVTPCGAWIGIFHTHPNCPGGVVFAYPALFCRAQGIGYRGGCVRLVTLMIG